MSTASKEGNRHTLYFAYGSNLNQEDLAEWCRGMNVDFPLGRRVGPAWLPDFRLVFDHFSPGRRGGVCNIRPAVGGVVPGALFEVPPGGWPVLDLKEGAATPPERCRAALDSQGTHDNSQTPVKSYQRVRVCVLCDDGREAAAHTYRVPTGPTDGFQPPGEHYLTVVRDGLAAQGLGAGHLEAAAINDPAAGLVDHLFVYGTLMAGECRHSLLAGEGAAEFRGEDVVTGTLLDLGSFPGLLLLNNPSGRVRGELYRLLDAPTMLRTLDRVEGFCGFGVAGPLFRRVLVRAGGAEMAGRHAWAYLWTDPAAGSPIPSGDWRSVSQ